MRNRLAPLVGHIVWARFPESEMIQEPGPKKRPVIILEADPQGLLCAPGTTKLKNTRYQGEFIVSPEDQPGLERTTKFALGKRLWLPATAEYFLIDGQIRLIGAISVVTGHRLHKEMELLGLA